MKPSLQLAKPIKPKSIKQKSIKPKSIKPKSIKPKSIKQELPKSIKQEFHCKSIKPKPKSITPKSITPERLLAKRPRMWKLCPMRLRALGLLCPMWSSTSAILPQILSYQNQKT